MMRLGKDAMYRQLDMPFDEALDLLRRSCRWPSRPRTSRRASRRSSRSGSRSGPAGEPASPCAAAPRPHAAAAARRRGAGAAGRQAARSRAAHDRHARRAARAALRRGPRESRGCLLEAGGQVDDALDGRRVPVILAPECSVALTTLPTALRHRPDARVLWLDAHGDFNTPGHHAQRLPRRHGARRRLRPVGRRPGRGGRRPRARGARRRARPRRRRAQGARAHRRDDDRRQHGRDAGGGQQRARAARRCTCTSTSTSSTPTCSRPSSPPPGGLTPGQLLDVLEAVADECELVGVEVASFEAPDDPDERSAAAAVALDVLEPLSTRSPRRTHVQRLSQGRGRTARGAAAAARAGRRPARAPREGAPGRRPGEDRAPARRRQAHRARAARPAFDEGEFTELGIHGRPHFSQPAMEDKEAPADGVITGYGKVDGRLVAVCRLRLHGDGRLDGHDRRAEGHAPARAGARQAHPDASGCSTRPARASRRRPARCSPARASCSARRS